MCRTVTPRSDSDGNIELKLERDGKFSFDPWFQERVASTSCLLWHTILQSYDVCTTANEAHVALDSSWKTLARNWAAEIKSSRKNTAIGYPI